MRQHTEHTEHHYTRRKLYGKLDWVWCCKTPGAPPVATGRPTRTRPCSPCDQQQPDAVASPTAPPVPSTSTTSSTRLPRHALSALTRFVYGARRPRRCMRVRARSSGAAMSILIHCYCFVHVVVHVLETRGSGTEQYGTTVVQLYTGYGSTCSPPTMNSS